MKWVKLPILLLNCVHWTDRGKLQITQYGQTIVQCRFRLDRSNVESKMQFWTLSSLKIGKECLSLLSLPVWLYVCMCVYCMYEFVCLCRYLVTVTLLICTYLIESMIYVPIRTKLSHNVSFQCHVHGFCTVYKVKAQTCVEDIACPCVLLVSSLSLSLSPSLEITQRRPIKSDIGDYTECYKRQQFSFVSVQGQGFFTFKPSAT